MFRKSMGWLAYCEYAGNHVLEVKSKIRARKGTVWNRILPTASVPLRYVEWGPYSWKFMCGYMPQFCHSSISLFPRFWPIEHNHIKWSRKIKILILLLLSWPTIWAWHPRLTRFLAFLPINWQYLDLHSRITWLGYSAAGQSWKWQ